jgi:hypothetical protein
MFGVLHACRSTLDEDLFAQWQAHLCGLCLSLRDGSGQWSRALTNTDAVLVSVLTEAQYDGPALRSQAGPCPLRGMRPAAVVPAGDAAARLGATASLTLAAAKAGDVVGERAQGSAGPGMRGRAAAALYRPLRRRALADSEMAAAVGVVDLLTDLSSQAAVEVRVRPGDPLAVVTAPTARACGQVFATSARLAGRPANEAPLRALGAAFGALAHLLDAVADLEADRRSGAFNPITATGTTLAEVRRECLTLVRTVRERFDALDLRDGRLARAVLVDGSHAAVHRAFDTGARCAAPTQTYPGGQPPAPGETAPTEDPEAPLPPADPPEKPPQPRPFWQAVLPWVGVYCTGYACCADHENPCTGKQHQAGCSGCGNGNCSGCDGCCDCCDCCDCNC